MTKKKVLRNAGLVALSGVMLGGAALGLTACGGGGGGGGGSNVPTKTDYTLSVFIFCSDADAKTNKAIADNWAKRYSEAHAEELGGNTITVNFSSEPLREDYDTTLASKMQAGSFDDIIYASPSQILNFSSVGQVLDLTQYVLATEETRNQVNSIWEDSLSFYGTVGTTGALGGNIRRANGISYDATNNKFVEPGSGEEVHIYGLPKDYSNFGLGYNRNYFDATFKKAYTTLKPSSKPSGGNRNVTSRLWSNSSFTQSGAVTHTGADTDSITYAVSGNYTNPYTGKTQTATKGQAAPFINVGVPTTYKPFNFYKYPTYQSALNAGDPLATSTSYFTNDAGYTITIPGFPGDTTDVLNADGSEKIANTYNEDAYYDADKANLTLTWAEYGALNWACAYLCNSFAWDDTNGNRKAVSNDGSAETDYAEWASGQGGVHVGKAGSNGVQDYYNVYGGEQYEQGLGGNLYVLPWLFSNDATFIDGSYTKVMNETKGGTAIAERNSAGTWNWTAGVDQSKIENMIGDATYNVAKTNLDGTKRNTPVEYGINSANFIETYGAFHEYCATWNAHVGQAGDVVKDSSDKGSVNGQTVFTAGASFFYGVGSWDVSEYQEIDQSVLSVGVMPTAVSDKLALYSEVRDAYYTHSSLDAGTKKVYANANNVKGTGDAAGSATKEDGDYAQKSAADAAAVLSGNKIFSQDEIWANQMLRQDKWGGRMDSVGFAVNSAVAASNQPAWYAAAATSLAMEYTISEQSQVTLTYGGAQIPNVKEQCYDYLNYNNDEGKDGAFKDMITPDDGDKWNAYYAVAREMATAAMSNDTRTVREFLSGKTVSYGDVQNEAVKYDEQYADVRLADFSTATVTTTKLAYSLRVLRMINYTRADRGILIRMQTGMNAVRDQTLYTTSSGWMGQLNATGSAASFLAYRNQATLPAGELRDNLLGNIAYAPAEVKGKTLQTPAVYCVTQSLMAQNALASGN